MADKMKDVVVIGGGVVGTSILRKLSYYDLDIALVEKQPDVCEGSSKANSGIVHTGFDAPPNTVEAEALKRSRELWPQLVEDLKIPFIPCGAVMIATSEEEKEIIEKKYIPNAEANGVEVSWISREEILEMNPAVTDKVIGGLLIEGESICDPFTATRSHAELAALNGAEIYLGAGVVNIEKCSEGLKLILEDGKEIMTRYAVNAAGLYSDQIARLIGDESFTITPRKGQFLLTEERVEISQVILPVPTPKSKGTLVSPVAFGGFLLGPTAEDQEDKTDFSTTEEGLEKVLAGCEKLVPGSREYESIRQFAGLRAVCSTGDYVIRPSEADKRLVHAAGIRSTGLSASPGIAELVAEQLQSVGLELIEKEDALYETPNLFDDSEEDQTGEIVCLCRSITRGEIENALKSPLPPTTIDGIKRRTGATLGDCQGNCCIPKILEIMEEHGVSSDRPLKGLQKSYLTVGRGNN
ncbi:NAD(P)/FAD-dependent oxidoreductase [Aeribacillus pallidus]|uniref:FAD/NAD(P)-binding oxidoreductase n=1 Tax=Aeribacillus pallidus TaxID=33936 RepID=A0A223E312_9BACI|nr:NAD(P)/FAD-dependent oxidoreductase [Aeribacillus pallidus]ASS89639.1 FAD/NAD(P)-binding oxidoreductase [Aeribacillus pallidus]